MAVIPRGLKFRVELLDAKRAAIYVRITARRSVCPILGQLVQTASPIRATSRRPWPWYEDRDEAVELVQKFEGTLWSTTLDHSPLDVVAWHGTNAPYKYDLTRFNTIGTISFDHPDPSIFTC